MRDLTLNEKISIKGLFHHQGASRPKLTMQEALHLWPRLFGYTHGINRWWLIRFNKNSFLRRNYAQQ